MRHPARRPPSEPDLAQGRAPHLLRARHPHQPGRIFQHADHSYRRAAAQRQLHLHRQQSGQGGEAVLQTDRQRSVHQKMHLQHTGGTDFCG